jgi:hypothetical protein
MPSLDAARIKQKFWTTRNGDFAFTISVIARRDGVQIWTGRPGAEDKRGYIDPRDQGWASAAEHFGRCLVCWPRRPAPAAAVAVWQPRQGRVLYGLSLNWAAPLRRQNPQPQRSEAEPR